MDIFVFSEDYKALGILESPMSVDYIQRFRSKGEFSVLVPLESFDPEKVKKNNYLLFDEENQIAGVIDKWKKATSQSDVPMITITGGLCDIYLYRRIVWGLYVKSGKAPDIADDLVKTQIISPSDKKRAISDLVIATNLTDKGDSIRYQVTGSVVGEALEDLCSSNGFGFSVRFDYENKRMPFSVLKGTDRTINQDVVAPCIFSQEYENILTSNYEENYSAYKNIALVGGEGEGAERKYVTVGDTSAYVGKSRIEVFVDARDIQSNDGVSTIPPDEYNEMLSQRGLEQLDTLRPIVNFDCVVNTQGNIRFGIDYFLGDKVTIQDNQMGVQLDAEISEVETVYSSTGKEIYITFGYNQLSLLKAIKVKVVS